MTTITSGGNLDSAFLRHRQCPQVCKATCTSIIIRFAQSVSTFTTLRMYLRAVIQYIVAYASKKPCRHVYTHTLQCLTPPDRRDPTALAKSRSCCCGSGPATRWSRTSSTTSPCRPRPTDATTTASSSGSASSTLLTRRAIWSAMTSLTSPRYM